MRLGGLADAGEDRAEAEQLQRERALGTRGDRYPGRPALRSPRAYGLGYAALAAASPSARRKIDRIRAVAYCR